MPHTPLPFPHKKKTTRKQTKPTYSGFDNLVLFVSVLYPFSAFPQVLLVFSGKTEGVAVLSWIVFLVCASLFLVYGIRRRVLPMIVSNSIWVIMDALVIIGILTSGAPITWL